eukprot:1831060-Ditylum_brightwellii.AAC.1
MELDADDGNNLVIRNGIEMGSDGGNKLGIKNGIFVITMAMYVPSKRRTNRKEKFKYNLNWGRVRA